VGQFSGKKITTEAHMNNDESYNTK